MKMKKLIVGLVAALMATSAYATDIYYDFSKYETFTEADANEAGQGLGMITYNDLQPFDDDMCDELAIAYKFFCSGGQIDPTVSTEVFTELFTTSDPGTYKMGGISGSISTWDSQYEQMLAIDSNYYWLNIKVQNAKLGVPQVGDIAKGTDDDTWFTFNGSSWVYGNAPVPAKEMHYVNPDNSNVNFSLNFAGEISDAEVVIVEKDVDWSVQFTISEAFNPALNGDYSINVHTTWNDGKIQNVGITLDAPDYITDQLSFIDSVGNYGNIKQSKAVNMYGEMVLNQLMNSNWGN